MWSRRSITRTRRPSSVATRSATVRPKKPEPTTTRSTAPDAMLIDSTGARRTGPPGSRTGHSSGDTEGRGVAEGTTSAPLRVVAVTYSPGDSLTGFLSTLRAATTRPLDVV